MIGFGDAMYEQQDGPDIRELSSRQQRARKQHKCCYCSDPILPGELYQVYTYIDGDDGGKFKSDKWHGVCPIERLETE